MRVTVEITRRPEIADPEGVTVTGALHDLGYSEVTAVRVDRTIHVDLDGVEREEAHRRVTEMCERLLANPVIEEFRVVIE